MNNIKDLTTYIDKENILLIKDNNFLINAFELRLLKRISSVFSKYSTTFNNEKLQNITNEYLTISFKNVNSEVCNSYKKLLYKYFDVINEYYNTHSDSKNKIKQITKEFIDKLYNKENPIMNESISNNYKNEIMNSIYVYDNISMNKEITLIIKNDTCDVINEINHNVNEYLIRCMKEIIKYVFGSRSGDLV